MVGSPDSRFPFLYPFRPCQLHVDKAFHHFESRLKRKLWVSITRLDLWVLSVPIFDKTRAFREWKQCVSPHSEHILRVYDWHTTLSTQGSFTSRPYSFSQLSQQQDRNLSLEGACPGCSSAQANEASTAFSIPLEYDGPAGGDNTCWQRSRVIELDLDGLTVRCTQDHYYEVFDVHILTRFWSGIPQATMRPTTEQIT